MNGWLALPWTFFKRDLLQALSYRVNFFLDLTGILLATATFYFLSRLIPGDHVAALSPYGGDYFSFVLIGLAFAGYLHLSLRGFAEKIRESQLEGTLEAMLVTRTGALAIVICSSLYDFVFASLRVVVYLLLGGLAFGARLTPAGIPAALLTLVLTITAFSSLGIFSAAFTTVIKRGDPLALGISALSLLLGGVYYPVAILPGWAQGLAQVLPITHALEAFRLCLIQGHGLSVVSRPLLVLLLITVILLPLSLAAFALAVRRARAEGSLSHY